jgi:chromosome segregation ATPase
VQRKPTITHYTINKLKSKFGIEHSNEVFGIKKEASYQCPRIDSFIEDIEFLEQHLNRLEKYALDNPEKINDLYINREYDVVKSYVNTLKNQFEELRESCDNLRNFGNDWKKLAITLFEDIPNNKKYINEKYRK